MPLQQSILSRILQNRLIFRGILIVAVVLGIVGSNDLFTAKTQKDIDSANSKREASIYIFLGIVVILAIQAILLTIGELNGECPLFIRMRSTCLTYGGPVFLAQMRYASRSSIVVITLLTFLLLLREAFLAATFHNQKQATNEALWYPLAVLPELISVCVLGFPGLVPSRAELREREQERERPAMPMANYGTQAV
jgi:hypothetical protein